MRTLLHHLVALAERRLDAPLPHLRELAGASVVGFLKTLLLFPLGSHRQHLPRDAWHLARVAATRTEDCDACLKIALMEARRDGVESRLLDAALSADAQGLPPELCDVTRFATDIAHGADAPELRSRLVTVYGQAAVVEMGLAIAIARFFPTFKRAIGCSQSCRRFGRLQRQSPMPN
jgi:alkylhydroperoxidase family enzyme